MNTLIILMMIVATSIFIIVLRQKMKNRIMANAIAALILLIYIFFIFVGVNFRFDPNEAAWANALISKDDEWLAKVDVGENQVHMFYDFEEHYYRTVFVKKLFIGYRSNTATYTYVNDTDGIQSLGSINIENNGRRYSAFLVKSIDPNVKEVGLVDKEGNVLITTAIASNEVISLAYEYTGTDTCFNSELIAFDKDDASIYYYGYEHGDNMLTDEAYKWYEYK